MSISNWDQVSLPTVAGWSIEGSTVRSLKIPSRSALYGSPATVTLQHNYNRAACKRSTAYSRGRGCLNMALSTSTHPHP